MNDGADRNTFGVARGATGGNTGDGTALIVTLGFRPKAVVLVNITDVTKIEKIDGMADNATLQTVAAGTMTIQTTSQITIDENGFVVSAAANANGKVLRWWAQ